VLFFLDGVCALTLLSMRWTQWAGPLDLLYRCSLQVRCAWFEYTEAKDVSVHTDPDEWGRVDMRMHDNTT
jgi:hypothetical protein